MRYFKLEELVDRETFETLGEKAWDLFNPFALIALDDLREYFGVPITVNNWAKGGTMQWRGYRSTVCPIGAVHSQHRKGNAFDCTIKGHPAPEARAIIRAYQENELLQHITRLEDKVSWVHFDCALLPRGTKRIYLFQP
jgi:hypothetical protein